MLSTIMTLNPMVLEDPRLRFDILMKSDLVFIKYLNPTMVFSNTMGFGVNLGDNMCF